MDGERGRLRRQVRSWLEEGRLPRPRSELWVGPGGGETCAICAEAIQYSQIEYEVANEHGWLSVHLSCFSLWKAEAASLAAASAAPDTAAPTTLGSLLFGGDPKPCESEADWSALVRAIAQGDRAALEGLYRRMHWPVLTFMENVTHDREAAAQLTASVFHDVWRQASVESWAGGSVAGWIMDLARLSVRSRAEERETLIPASASAAEPDWDHAAPGIFNRILARDTDNDRVSMLVRLAPGAAYPPHTHAGTEELYLLEGELFIDSRKLAPGDYYRAEAGSGDQHVWSETGCTCVLLTSTRDILH